MKRDRFVLISVLVGFWLFSGCTSETPGPNRAPVAVAGPDRVASVDETLTFNGSQSYDPDGDTISYQWTLVAGPGTATLSAERAVATELTPDVMGVWVVRLVVSDGKRESEPDVVQVRVTGGQPCTTDIECRDDLYCNGVESCVDGRCMPGSVDCNDGNVCTQDMCNEDLDRCENPPVTEPPGTEGPVGDATCSDGADNDCDGLTDGVDTGCIVCTSDAECNDQNECTDDSCSGSACVNAPVTEGTACDDGLWCTDDGSGGGDVCRSGRCVGEAARDCAGAGDQCNGFTCDEATNACVAVPVADGTSCDDGLWCTENDECTGGVCGGADRDCSAESRECVEGVCNEGLDQCEGRPMADGELCDDGEYCTVGETCTSGSCLGGGPRDCTEVADECNDEACNDQVDACQAVPKSDGTECGARSCSGLDWMRQTCVVGACTGSELVMACDDGRDCTTDACDVAAGCTNTALADGSECGARYCDGLEHRRQTCLTGVCSGTELLTNCDDGNDCTADTCDGVNGCGNASLTDGTECGSRYCTGLEWRRQICQTGQCNSNALETDCNDANVCTDDGCDPVGGCTNTNNTLNCDDSDACTMNDVCANGACAGVPLDADGDNHIAEGCPSGDDCDDGRANVHPGMFEGSFGDPICSDTLDNDCDTLTDAADDTCQQCTQDSDCDDNDVCNGLETCVGVGCVAGTPLTCDDGLYCTGAETCDAVQGCQTAVNPCPETECNHCNETNDNCFDVAGTGCTNDGLYCTGVEECNGAGLCQSLGNPCPETECNHCNDAADNCFDPAGTGCANDGLYCTGVETCNGAGDCNSAGSPCPETECEHCYEPTDSCYDPSGTGCTNDGLYCTGAETCDGSGGCNSAGSPCTETECNTCQENTDSCFDLSGALCGSGSDTDCTNPDTCDGSGSCQDNHENPGTGCDDGTYCNGADNCNATGVCANHAGDPCSGGAECNAHCNEGDLNCYDSSGTSCGDGSDTDCTDPDSCDGSGVCVDNHETNGTPCDDGLYCTAVDTCNGSGVCQGSGDPCGAGEFCIEADDSCVACLDNDDCAACEYCSAGNCMNQPAGEDYKGDCPLVECYTGECDGGGNCQPSSSGTPCGDPGSGECDSPDQCDGTGTCDLNHEAPGTVCNDLIYCNGTDECDDAGGCTVHTGDPCSAGSECADNCNEGPQDCFDAPGTPCGSGNSGPCDSADTCDGAGVCDPNHEAPGTSCDDGTYCNGADECDAVGVCSVHPGDPCAGGAQCNQTCNEGPENCYAAEGSSCDDGDACTLGDDCNATGTCQPGGPKDGDGDNYIDEACPGGDDCDDTDPLVNPGASEGPVCDVDATCFDGKDNECDGDTDTADGDCSASDYICVYGPPSVRIGSTGTITVRLDSAGYDEGQIICYTDNSRLRAPVDLLSNDFESDFSGFTRSDPDPFGYVQRRNDAQSPLSSGSWGVRICRNHWLLSDPIDTTGRTRIQLRYAARQWGLDDDEFLITEYSPNDGTTWYVLDVQGDDYHAMIHRWFTHILPPRCENVSNLRIRFRIQGANNDNDCAHIDDVSISDLPDPTVSWTLLANHFEPSEGNSTADICNGETIVYFDSQGNNSSEVCLRGDAQNPNTIGSQGVRIVDNDPTWLGDTNVDTRYVPSGSDLVSEFWMQALSLNQDQYVNAWYYNGSGWYMMNGVGVNTRTQYDWFRFVWEPSGIGVSNAEVRFYIPSEAGLGGGDGAYIDDYEFTWYRASHDVIGPFSDQGDGTYTANIQSDLAGTANVTCIFYGADPPLFTDGTGDNSGPAPVDFMP